MVAVYGWGLANNDNRNRDKNFQTLPVFDENTSSIATLATINQIPIVYLSANIDDSSQEISDYVPDVILVSCFASKIPEQICTSAKLGCFNLHPSLLPAFRGPTPLFWQFRAGIENFGITLHRLTQRWDAGNIIAQTIINMEDGVTYTQACRSLALAGSKLIISSLQQLQNHNLNETVQKKHLISYQGYPDADDFIISNQWSAQRIYNFICATRNWAIPYPCFINHTIYRLLDIIDHDQRAYSGLKIKDNHIRFPCNPGYITALFIDAKTPNNAQNKLDQL